MIAGPAAANEVSEDYDPSVLDACLFKYDPTDDKSACVGLGTADCMADVPDDSTVEYEMCISAEWQHWDAHLNVIYSVLLIQQAELDQSLQAHDPTLENPVDVMRRMQRAWITYRDSACDWETLQWSGNTGTGARLATVECMMHLTAQQTVFLGRYSQ
jgi:uncharacterized protein YecT (DUF1311 family)